MSSRVVALWTLLLCVSAHAQIRTEQVHFAAGSSGITLRGKIKGGETVDYQLSARGGQSMTVTLAPSNPSAYFNVLPPGSNDVAIFIGSRDGNAFEGTLPADGDYKVRVYLMRNAARRHEVSDYTLQIAIKGTGRKPQAARGYKDHDEIRMVENNIVRQFRLYDSTGKQTGKMRQLIYKLVPGEAGWRLELANTSEFSLP